MNEPDAAAIAAADAPAGFQPVTRYGPFMSSVGPLFYRRDGDALIVGVRVGERHTNLRGIAHGGMLVTLADNAMGYVLSSTRQPPMPMVTVNLSTDFLDVARPGDWVEAHVDILRVGGRLAYADCRLVCGARKLLRASGVFALMPPVAAGAVGAAEERSDG